MAFNPWAIRKVFINPESTFATSSGTEGDYVRVPAVSPDFKPGEGHIRRDVAQPRLTRYPGFTGKKGGTFTFRVHAEGLTTNDGAAQVTVTPWLDECLLSSGLTKLAGTGSEKTGTNSDADSVEVTADAGFKLGGMLGYKLDADGLLLTRLIDNTISNIIDVAPPWTSGSADLDSIVTVGGDLTIFSPATYWAEDGLAAPNGNGVFTDPGTATFVVVGSGFEYTLKGCRGNVKLVSDGESLMFEFTYNVATYTASSLAPTAAFPTAKTSLRLPGLGKMWWGDNVAATATTIPSRDVSFDFGLTWTEKLADEGTEGMTGWAPSASQPKASFKAYAASAYRTAKSAASEYLWAYQVGTSVTNALAVAMRKAQIVDYPAEEDVGTNVGHTINLESVNAGTGLIDATSTQKPDAVLCLF